MYDFLQSESFWMETIIAALITVAVSLLLALLAVGPKLKALGERIQVNKDAMQPHKDLLSQEHKGITKGIDELKSRLNIFKRCSSKTKAAENKPKGRLRTCSGPLIDSLPSSDMLKNWSKRYSVWKWKISD